MAAQRTTFDKLQRERAKKAKAAAKRERRQRRGEEQEGTEESAELVPEEGEELSAPELLERIEALHARFDAGKVSFEDFEEQKTDLFTRLSQLPIE